MFKGLIGHPAEALENQPVMIDYLNISSIVLLKDKLIIRKNKNRIIVTSMIRLSSFDYQSKTFWPESFPVFRYREEEERKTCFASKQENRHGQ